MTLYLDVLLLENFIVNRFLLEITAQTIKISINRLYVNLAAFIGSLYILIILQDSLNYLKSFPVKFLIALIMIIITFRKKDIIFNLKVFILFILYSMVLAGLCVFIELNSVKDLDSNSLFIYEIYFNNSGPNIKDINEILSFIKQKGFKKCYLRIDKICRKTLKGLDYKQNMKKSYIRFLNKYLKEV